MEKLSWNVVLEALADAMGTTEVGVTFQKYPKVRPGAQVFVSFHLTDPERGSNLAEAAPFFQRHMPT